MRSVVNPVLTYKRIDKHTHPGVPELESGFVRWVKRARLSLRVEPREPLVHPAHLRVRSTVHALPQSDLRSRLDVRGL